MFLVSPICATNNQSYAFSIQQDQFESTRSLPIKICVTMAFIVRATLGNIYYLGLIHFEKFGEDPMKRSTMNRICSSICFFLVLSSCISQPLYLFRILQGPVSPIVAKIILLDGGVANWMFLVGMTEIVLLQNLRIFKYHIFVAISEDFLSRLVLLWNFGFVYGSLLSQVYLDILPSGPYEFLIGHMTTRKPPTGQEYYLVVTVFTVATMFLGTLTLNVKKRIERSKLLPPNQQQQQSSFNNQSLNFP